MYIFKKFIVVIFSLIVLSAYAKESPTKIAGAKTVSTSEAKKLFDQGVLFVDTRSDKDWEAGRIPDALHLNVKTSFSEKALLEEMGKNDPVVMYCNGASCLRSAKATEQAVAWGFTNVYFYRDGFPAWKAAGYVVE